jgi:predicted ATPase
MAISEIRVVGYRSIYDLTVHLQPINVIVGPNGSGKTNLYRSMYLLHGAAAGNLSRTLAEEGGMPSALWAGPRARGPVRLTLGVSLDDFEYELACGLPTPDSNTPDGEGSRFVLDPEVKAEKAVYRSGRRPIEFMVRKNGSVWLRDLNGEKVTYPLELGSSESTLSQLREPHRFPELSVLRQGHRGLAGRLCPYS